MCSNVSVHIKENWVLQHLIKVLCHSVEYGLGSILEPKQVHFLFRALFFKVKMKHLHMQNKLN